MCGRAVPGSRFEGLDVYSTLQHFFSTLTFFFNPPRRFFNPGLEKNVTPTKSTHGPYIPTFFFHPGNMPFSPWKHVFSTLEPFFPTHKHAISTL